MLFRKKPKNKEDGKDEGKEDKQDKKEAKENSWKNAVSHSQLQQVVYSDEDETKTQ